MTYSHVFPEEKNHGGGGVSLRAMVKDRKKWKGKGNDIFPSLPLLPPWTTLTSSFDRSWEGRDVIFLDSRLFVKDKRSSKIYLEIQINL